MTRNIGEPCMCGDPACWVCGDGTPDDAPPPFDATIVPPASLADAYAAVVAQRDAALRFERQAHAEKNAALARATAAEAANADLRARVAELEADIAAANRRADSLAQLLTTAAHERDEARGDLMTLRGQTPMEYATAPDLAREAAAGRALRAAADIEPVRSLGAGLIGVVLPLSYIRAYDAATAPATTAAAAGEVQS